VCFGCWGALRCIWLSVTSDFGMGASAKLTHMFECTVGPVTYFVCVPDVTGTIPVSVVMKGLGTPFYGGCYIFVWGIVGECVWVMPFGYLQTRVNNQVICHERGTKDVIVTTTKRHLCMTPIFHND
jgi:hypothetical protein